MDASIMLAKTKARLIEAAIKEYGKIESCGEKPFREEDGVLYFWFTTLGNKIHSTHTHLIHESIKSEN